jgi:hypothetical protein
MIPNSENTCSTLICMKQYTFFLKQLQRNVCSFIVYLCSAPVVAQACQSRKHCVYVFIVLLY